MTIYYNPSYDRSIWGGLLDHKVEALTLEILRIRTEDQGKFLWANESLVSKEELELFGHILDIGFRKSLYSK